MRLSFASEGLPCQITEGFYRCGRILGALRWARGNKWRPPPKTPAAARSATIKGRGA